MGGEGQIKNQLTGEKEHSMLKKLREVSYGVGARDREVRRTDHKDYCMLKKTDFVFK